MPAVAPLTATFSPEPCHSYSQTVPPASACPRRAERVRGEGGLGRTTGAWLSGVRAETPIAQPAPPEARERERRPPANSPPSSKSPWSATPRSHGLPRPAPWPRRRPQNTVHGPISRRPSRRSACTDIGPGHRRHVRRAVLRRGPADPPTGPPEGRRRAAVEAVDRPARKYFDFLDRDGDGFLNRYETEFAFTNVGVTRCSDRVRVPAARRRRPHVRRAGHGRRRPGLVRRVRRLLRADRRQGHLGHPSPVRDVYADGLTDGTVQAVRHRQGRQTVAGRVDRRRGPVRHPGRRRGRVPVGAGSRAEVVFPGGWREGTSPSHTAAAGRPRCRP